MLALVFLSTCLYTLVLAFFSVCMDSCACACVPQFVWTLVLALAFLSVCVDSCVALVFLSICMDSCACISSGCVDSYACARF